MDAKNVSWKLFEKTGYAYSESTDMKSMAAAAHAASAIAAGSADIPPVNAGSMNILPRGVPLRLCGKGFGTQT